MHQAQGESNPHHKRSNISSFAHNNKTTDKFHFHHPAPTPLRYRDIITLQSNDHSYLGLHNLTDLMPGSVPDSLEAIALGLFEVVGAKGEEEEVSEGGLFYLRNIESNLYLSAEKQILKSFTNVLFQKEPNQNSLFSFRSYKPAEYVYNKELVSLHNRASGLLVRVQSQSREGKGCSVWLTESGDWFTMTVVNRWRQHSNLLNNYDIVLISSEVKCENKYLGITKHRAPLECAEKKDTVGSPLEVDINTHYFHPQNCSLQYYSEEERDYWLGSCLWQLQKVTHGSDSSYLVRSKEEITLRHVETGLCLLLASGCLVVGQQGEVKVENVQRYSCEVSSTMGWDPIYITHSVRFSYYPDKQFQLQRVASPNYLRLFNSHALSFLHHLAKFMADPRALNDDRQALSSELRLYMYLYQLGHEGAEKLADGGFYWFEFSLKWLQLVRSLLREEQGWGEVCSIRKGVVGGVVGELLKFMSMVIATNATVQRITAEDHKRTKEIIQIVFVMYGFQADYTLNLMVALANADPHLVVKLLTERLCAAPHFAERVALLKAISQVIDQFRRVNFDEENLKNSLEKHHQLLVGEETLYVQFQRKEHDLFDLMASLCRLNEPSAHTADERETYSFYVYLLSIAKLLFNARAVLGREETVGKAFAKDLVRRLSSEFVQNPNIDAQTIALALISELLVEICNREFIFCQQLHFTIYAGDSLEADTRLAHILRLNGDTLEWVFSQQALLQVLQSVRSAQWERQHSLWAKLQLLVRLVEMLTTFVSTCSFDLSTLHQMERFCMDVATLFYRFRLHEGAFQLTRQLISSYAQQLQLALVEGLKAALDELIGKLKLFFAAVLVVKKRLYIYPMCSDKPTVFKFSEFTVLYSQLVLNQRLRTEIPALLELVSLNAERLEVEGLIIGGEGGKDCLKAVEGIVEDLFYLGIMMETYRMYGQERALRQNMVASMKLKILNIEDAFKLVHKHRHFPTLAHAYALAPHLLDFLLENAHEPELIAPLLDSLLDKLPLNASVLPLLQQKQQLFFSFLRNYKNTKNARALLRWVGRQLEQLTEPVSSSQVEFIYAETAALMEEEQQAHPNLLYLVSLLLEVGIRHSAQEELLYARLIETSPCSDFIANCASPRALRIYREKMEKDFQWRPRIAQLALQLTAIIRLAQCNGHLLSHLHNLLSHSQLLSVIASSQSYGFFKPLLGYLGTDPHLTQPGSINRHLHFVLHGLTSADASGQELADYHSRPCLERERESKAATHFCRSNTLPLNPRNQPADKQVHSCYWEYLMWVPFYAKPEGLLVYLEQIVKVLAQTAISEPEIEETLDNIADHLKHISNKQKLDSEQHKMFISQLSFLLSLLHMRKLKTHWASKGTDRSPLSQQEEDIYKLLNDHQLLKPFMQQVISAQPRQQQLASFRSSSIRIRWERDRPHHYPEETVNESEIATLRERTHHSLITPDKRESADKPFESPTLTCFQVLALLKPIIGYRIRVGRKLQSMLVEYLEGGGSLGQLDVCLNEEIGKLRSRIVDFVEVSNMEYQFSWRKVKPITKLPITDMLLQQTISLGVEVVSVDKLEELLNEDRLETFCQLLHELSELEPDATQLAAFHSQYCLFESMLERILDAAYVQQWQLFRVTTAADHLLDILIRYRPKPTREDCKKETINHQRLYSALAHFILRISYLTSSERRLDLFLLVVFLVGKVEFRYLCKFNLNLQALLKSRIIKFIPEKSYVIALTHLLKLSVSMIESRTSLSIAQFAGTYQYLEGQLKTTFGQDYYSDNMASQDGRQFLTSMFDFLQLLLTRTQLQHPLSIPHSLVAQLVNLQCMFYLQVFKSSHPSDSRLLCYQSLAIQSLSFIHTLGLAEGEKIWNLRLLQQRLLYVGQVFNLQELRQVYQFYEKQFSFCVLRDETGKVTVQAFPVEENEINLKEEFTEIMGGYYDSGDKKDILLSYAILSSEEEPQNEAILNCMHKIQPYCVVISSALSVASIIQRVIDPTPTHSSILFKVLLLINLLLILFLVGQRLCTLLKIGNLQVRLGREPTLKWYLWHKQKSFLLLSCFLIYLNLQSFFMPTYSSLLMLITLFFKRRQSSTLFKMFQSNTKVLFFLTLLAGAFLFLFALFSPPEDSVMPIVRLQARYNLSFISTNFHIWQNSFYNDPKVLAYMLTNNSFRFLFMAILIFHYVQEGLKAEDKAKSCELCILKKDREGEQSKDQTTNHIKHEHNIFTLLSCFKYVLRKPYLLATEQEKMFCKMIKARDRTIYF